MENPPEKNHYQIRDSDQTLWLVKIALKRRCDRFANN
jgi:hypothetical protein